MPKNDISEELDCNPWKMTNRGWVFLGVALFLGAIWVFMFLGSKEEADFSQPIVSLPKKVDPPIEETLKKASSTMDPRKIEKVSQETMDGLTAR